MSTPTATAHIDGASRGNPGPAAYAVVLRIPGEPAVEEAQTLGTATNNFAEYTALVRALELAAEHGVKAQAAPPAAEASAPRVAGGAPERLEEEALALLNAAAKAWAAGKEDPTPVEVWDRLWRLLGEHGVRK